LVWMEWRSAGWSVCLPLLISPCTIRSRSSLLAPAHPGGPRKRAVKRLLCSFCVIIIMIHYLCSTLKSCKGHRGAIFRYTGAPPVLLLLGLVSSVQSYVVSYEMTYFYLFLYQVVQSINSEVHLAKNAHVLQKNRTRVCI